MLSRAICRYRLFRAAPQLTARQRDSAARLFAEAHAPFAQTGTLLLRCAAGFGIWYWDRSKLAAHEPLRQVSPESVWRDAGDGWRIVQCVEGFEAQYWQDDSLIASSWRRQIFTQAQWTSFALSVDQPASPATTEAPTPVSLPLANSAWRAAIVKPSLGWKDAERAGVSVAICAVAVAALFAAQALKSERGAEHSRVRAAAIEDALRQDQDVARALEQRRLIRDFATIAPPSQVLMASAEAHEALSRFGLRASTWRVSADGMSVIVDAPIGEAPVRDIVAAMEEAPHLCAVVPEIAGAGRFELRADVCSEARQGRT